MTSDNEKFAAWLRDKARAAGYEIDGPRSGGKAKLATDSGVSRGQVGRALAGDTIPDITSQRGLAKALRVPVLEMLVASGYLTGEDIAEAFQAWQARASGQDWASYTTDPPAVTPRSTSYEIERAAELLGVPPGQRRVYVRMMKSMALLAGSTNTAAILEGEDAPTVSEDYRMRGASPTVEPGETSSE